MERAMLRRGDSLHKGLAVMEVLMFLMNRDLGLFGARGTEAGRRRERAG